MIRTFNGNRLGGSDLGEFKVIFKTDLEYESNGWGTDFDAEK
jgi:hypothetical protein